MGGIGGEGVTVFEGGEIRSQRGQCGAGGDDDGRWWSSWGGRSSRQGGGRAAQRRGSLTGLWLRAARVRQPERRFRAPG